MKIYLDGFYDENKNYEIKCESIKCHGAFNLKKKD